MAGEIKGITVEIGGDTSELAKALTALNKPIKSAEKELREVEKLLKMDPGNTVALTQKQQLLAQRVDDTRKKLETLKAAKEQADAAMADGTQVNQEEYRKLQREIELTEQELRQVTVEADKFSKTGERIEAVGDKMEAVGQKVKGVTDAFKPLSAAILAVDAAAIKVGADYESQMSKVQAITTANQEDMALLRDTTREIGLSDEFVATARTAGEAMEYMGLAGWDAEQIVANLPAVLNTATAAAMDLGETSDIVTDYLTAFNMKTDEAARLADVMAYAQSNSNTNIQQLAGAYRNCAANANSMGYEVENVTADLAMMANQGLKGEKAGTALNAVYRDLTKEMKDGAVTINGHSIAVQDQAGNYRQLSDIISDVQAATAGMGTAEKNAALMAVFTSESLRGLNLLLNAGGEVSAKFAAELRNSGGAAENAAAIMRDNLAGDVEVTKGKLEAAGLEIYDVFEPALRKAVSVAGDMAAGLAEMDESGQKAIVTVGALAAGVPVAGTAIAGLSKVLSVAANGLSLLITSPIAPWVAGISAAAVAVGTLGVKLTEAGREEEARHKKAVEMLQTERDALRETVTSREAAITAAVSESVHTETLAGELRRLADESGRVQEKDRARVDFILGELNGALGTEYSMVDGVITKYDELCGTIDLVILKKRAAAVMDTMSDDYSAAISNIQNYYGELASARDDYTAKIEEAESAEKAMREASLLDYSAAADKYIEATNRKSEAYTAYQTAQKKVEDAEKVIGDVERIAAATATDSADEINAALSSVTNEVVRAKDTQTEALKTQAGNMADNALSIIRTYEEMSKSTNSSVRDMSDNVKTNIEEQLREFEKLGIEIPPEVAAAMSAAGLEFKNGSVQMVEATESGLSGMKGAVEKSTSDGLLGGTEAAFGPMPAKMQQNGRKMSENTAAGIKSGAPAVSSAASSAASGAVTAAQGQMSSGSSIGRDFAAGIGSGISSGQSGVISKAISLAKSAVAAVKNFLGIKSPSRVMRDEVGKMITAGMAEGIEENSGDVIEAAEAVNAEILTAEEQYLREKERIDNEHAEYDEAQRVKQYEERLASAKDAAEKQKIIDEETRRQKERADDKYLEGLKAAAEEEKKIAQKRTDAAKETADAYADMVKAVAADFDTVNGEIEKLAARLQDYRGDELFTRNVIAGENGEELMSWVELPDLSAATRELEEYRDVLLEVKDRGADGEIFDILRTMDVEEGTAYASALLAATDAEFDRYMAQWDEKRAASQQIATVLYADEAEAITTQLEAVLSDSVTAFKEYGYQAGQEYMDGFRDAMRELNAVASVYNEYVAGTPRTAENPANAGGTVNYNVTQNITGGAGSPAENAAALRSILHQMEITGILGV